MEKIVSTLVDYIWGNGLVYLALAVGLYFTIITRGVQFRYLPEMIRLLNEKQESGAGYFFVSGILHVAVGTHWCRQHRRRSDRYCRRRSGALYFG